MRSSRLKLTLIFLLLSIAIAAAIVLSADSTRNRNVYKLAARDAVLLSEVARGLIEAAAPRGGSLLESDSTTGGFILAPSIQRQLATLPDYLIVVGTDSTIYFASAPVGRLNDTDWTNIYTGLTKVEDGGPAGVMRLSVGTVVFVGARINDPTTGLIRVIAGSRTEPESTPRELLTVLYVIIPLMIVLAVTVFWFVTSGVFQRIERVRTDVAAISDGKSLHRRLSNEGASEELDSLITTLNSMIARLETSFLSLRRFTADASHELKTPLAVIRADIERAMHEKTTDLDRQIALEESLQEVRRMSDLVDGLLTLARSDEKQIEIVKEPVNLTALTHEVYETALILGEAAGVNVQLSFITDVTVVGDHDRLRQLFLNLVTNAIKYTPAGGRVDIGLGVHASTATFAVRDTGIGISASDLPHVFDRFWRADRVRTRGSERTGAGLGLAISQWIAQAHSGSLTVSSRLGKGSLFTVILPLNFTES